MGNRQEKTTITIPSKTEASNTAMLQDISWSSSTFGSHHDIAAALTNKHPYTITILIEPLNPRFRNNKKYVKKTKIPIPTKYTQLLYRAFFDEFGHDGGNRLFGDWLKQYSPLFTQQQREHNPNIIDEYIIEHELEPRYKQEILSRFKSHTNLFQERHEIKRDRYYNLPAPLQHIDWRNPFDNIFVWQEDGHKVARRGGSGSSGGRETNSMFIFGLMELNKIQPVPSYVFVYTESNELAFVRRFDSLCIPANDVGSNYHRINKDEIGRLEQGAQFLEWDILGTVAQVDVITK